MPRYDKCDTLADTISHEKRKFEVVPMGSEQRFDVVICSEHLKVEGHWTKAPVHMGVVVDPGLVLHITSGMTSCVDKIKAVDALEIRRVLT